MPAAAAKVDGFVLGARMSKKKKSISGINQDEGKARQIEENKK
jgi:hypothetical protein